MPSAFSALLAAAVHNSSFRGASFTPPGTLYVHLYTSNPTANDTGAEVTGGNYVPVVVTFTALSSGQSSNVAAVTFDSPRGAWGLVSHIGIRDSLIAGNLLAYGALRTAKSINAGDLVAFAAGTLVLDYGLV